MSCIHHCIIQSSVISLRILCALLIHPSPYSHPATTDLLLSHRFAFSRMSHCWIIQCIAFADWLLLLSNMYLRFFHVFLCFLRFLDIIFRRVELNTVKLIERLLEKNAYTLCNLKKSNKNMSGEYMDYSQIPHLEILCWQSSETKEPLIDFSG